MNTPFRQPQNGLVVVSGTPSIGTSTLYLFVYQRYRAEHAEKTIVIEHLSH